MSGTVWTMNRMDLPDNEGTWTERKRQVMNIIKEVLDTPKAIDINITFDAGVDRVATIEYKVERYVCDDGKKE